MALILEQLDHRQAHVVRRVALDRNGLTIGRGLDRDFIVDDPFVDAAHARLVLDESGAAQLDDLGSVNGIDVVRGARVRQLALVAGTTFFLGRTPFRVVDRDAPVPPARPLSTIVAGAQPWFERGRWQLLLPLLLLIFSGATTYIAGSTREAASAALGMALAILVFVAIWAGVWALVGRALVRRPAFVVHSTIASALFLASLFTTWVFEWTAFLVPAGDNLWSSIDVVVSTAMLLLTIVWHLGAATSLSVRRRWIGASVSTAILGGIGLAFVLAADDGFTDVPEFEGTVRYAPAALIPATDVDGFRDAISELRVEVDSLRSRGDDGRGR